MTNIAKAIEREKEYISYRAKGKEPFHLIDAIKECGFETLDEYFKEKKKHEFRCQDFNLIEADTLSCIAKVMQAIASEKPAVVMVDIDRTVVFPRIDTQYDTEYCLKNNIVVLPVGVKGDGALVSVAGDLGVGICIPRSLNLKHSFIVDGFIDILRKYTDKEVYNDGNDIMVDGKKVCGFGFYTTNNVIMAITPITLSDRADLISKICLKSHQKVPGYIDFIDRDTLRQEVYEWLQVH